jgi:hypothetical protein
MGTEKFKFGLIKIVFQPFYLENIPEQFKGQK